MPLDPLGRLQAVLFAAPHTLTPAELAVLLDCDEDDIRKQLAALRVKLDADPASGITVERVAGGYRLATKPEAGEWVERVRVVVKPGGLSAAALETLAIVAYRQPVTRAEIEAIRGVRSESALVALLERGLIEEVGRKDAPGRPVLFGTTERFLAAFGLDSLDDLPPLPAETTGKDPDDPSDPADSANV